MMAKAFVRQALFYNDKQPLSQLRCQLPYKGSLKPLLIGEVAHRAGDVAFCRPWDGTYDAACECELRPANCVL